MNSPEHSPEPAATWTEARPVVRRSATRPAAAVMLVGCATVLGMAVYLTPDERGFGTHEQLSGGPCGMLIMTGFPCPTCGMTTAFAHAVRGQWAQAFWAQPAGFVLAAGTIGAAGVALWTLLRGRWPRVSLRFLTPYRLFLFLLILLLGSWAFKIVVGLAEGQLPYR